MAGKRALRGAAHVDRWSRGRCDKAPRGCFRGRLRSKAFAWSTGHKPRAPSLACVSSNFFPFPPISIGTCVLPLRSSLWRGGMLAGFEARSMRMWPSVRSEGVRANPRPCYGRQVRIHALWAGQVSIRKSDHGGQTRRFTSFRRAGPARCRDPPRKANLVFVACLHPAGMKARYFSKIGACGGQPRPQRSGSANCKSRTAAFAKLLFPLRGTNRT